MTNNDVLRSLRYILNISDSQMGDMIAAGGSTVTTEQVQQMLLFDSDAQFLPCADDVMTSALDGMVYAKRGKDESRQAPAPELPVTNNTVLKKCRIAFELKDVDMHEIMAGVNFPVSKPEMSALFRRPGHKNFRACGDQFLRNFLKGLALRTRAE